MIRLDHFALAAQTLEIGQDYVRKRTGLTVPLGGVHQGMGTHNCLMATGDESYLEIIANDPNQPAPKTPRPFDLDNGAIAAKTAQEPHIQAVILRTDDAARDATLARAAGVDLGTVVDAARGDLRWVLVLREDRSLALDGAAPALIEWPEGPHVSHAMPDEGLVLTNVTINTPHAEKLNQLFSALNVQDPRLCVARATARRITATYKTPEGSIVTLG